MGHRRWSEGEVEAVLRGSIPTGREDLSTLADAVAGLREEYAATPVEPSAELRELLAGRVRLADLADPSDLSDALPTRPTPATFPATAERRRARAVPWLAGVGVLGQVVIGATAAGAVGVTAGATGLLPERVQGVYERVVDRMPVAVRLLDPDRGRDDRTSGPAEGTQEPPGEAPAGDTGSGSGRPAEPRPEEDDRSGSAEREVGGQRGQGRESDAPGGRAGEAPGLRSGGDRGGDRDDDRGDRAVRDDDRDDREREKDRREDEREKDREDAREGAREEDREDGREDGREKESANRAEKVAKTGERRTKEAQTRAGKAAEEAARQADLDEDRDEDRDGADEEAREDDRDDGGDGD